ncbi:hypothetical protein NEOLEDRAFT_353443 [Neolentinus lepideus HHB14362 ss-1]|uniref:Uncharacterized protein n=1 Tax=Neolentinus lepideus HHB14362 ss-1 TaxID=1314782 RepID=A0A165SK76_9AGAM|nr:hypothetical protein NEOLEDRAFT_353443 [Neolentinus lepideus HHB14362 ss-1]
MWRQYAYGNRNGSEIMCLQLTTNVLTSVYRTRNSVINGGYLFNHRGCIETQYTQISLIFKALTSPSNHPPINQRVFNSAVNPRPAHTSQQPLPMVPSQLARTLGIHEISPTHSHSLPFHGQLSHRGVSSEIVKRRYQINGAPQSRTHTGLARPRVRASHTREGLSSDQTSSQQKPGCSWDGSAGTMFRYPRRVASPCHQVLSPYAPGQYRLVVGALVRRSLQQAKQLLVQALCRLRLCCQSS